MRLGRLPLDKRRLATRLELSQISDAVVDFFLVLTR